MSNEEELSVKKIDLYMMDDEVDRVVCDRCSHEVRDVSELYPYYDIMVCEDCNDKLRLRDEKESLASEVSEMGELDD